jgi:ubiquinone/menaquinone biosynthesis C-methylase UbiE
MTEQHIATPNFESDKPLPTERQSLLDTFAEQPEDNTTWNIAYSWVRAEGDELGQDGVASDISADELIAMAETVRTTTQAERYELMTRYTQNGRLWFDVIKGFSTDSLRQELKHSVETSAQQNQVPFFRTLDLGTGIGNSLVILEENARQVIGVDRDKALLDIAQKRAGDNTVLVQADITALPFDNGSFDLVSSLGIEGSLDKDTQAAFYTELARVMMPGCSYLTAYYNYPYMPSDEMLQITQTSKAMLADMICDTVSGGASIVQRLDEDETNNLFAELGLQKECYLEVSEDEKNHVVIQVITKEVNN